MIICSVNSVSKMYGGNPIFDNLSFEINEGEKVGLVGRNGSGKTTLIQLLSGKETPDNGQIHWKKGTTIGYLEQIPTTDPALTVKDVLKQAFRELLKTEEKMKQIEYSMSEETEPKQLDRLMNEYGNLLDFFTIHGGYEMEANIDKIVHGLKLHHMVDQTFATLSGGEKTKIGLAHILLKHPDFLLLDEPTNHLDLMAVEWLGEFLKNYQGTVLIISHDRYFLDEVVNKILDLEDGEIKCYHTDFTGYVEEKQEQLLRDFQAYEEQQKKIKKMKEAIKRLKEWANSANPPNEGLHKRARNMERALERMEKLNRPNMNPKKINLEMESAARSGKDVVSVHNVEKRFGEMILFTNVNLEVKYKERVAIVGENGSGKSTLIKMILEQVQPDYGEIRLGSNVKIGYLSQHVFADSKDVTVLDKFRENVRVTEGEARNILSRFLFFGHAVFRKISKLSGGEKMRLRLAELMHQEINFLVLDEPTNHLDIESREVLEDALEEFDGTILAVSHDRYFLNKLFEKIYWIDSNQVYMFNGDYNWAKKKMGEFQQNNRRKEEKQNTKAPLILAKSDEKRPRQEESKNIIKKIEVIGERILEIEGKLSATKNLNVLQQLFKEKVELEEKWEELFSQLDA